MLLGLACVAAIASCRGATQIELEVTTDFACHDLADVAIAVAAPPLVESAPPVTVTSQCDPATGRVGALVVVPSGAKNDEIALRVVGRRSADACDAPAYGPHCIVARRALRFVPHASLTLPVLLRASCEGIPCNADETCVAGECVPSAIDPSTCEPSCGEASLDLDAGRPPPRDAAPDVAMDAPVDAATPFCPQGPELVACFRFEGDLTDESASRLVPAMTASTSFAQGKHGSALVVTSTPPATLVTFAASNVWNQAQITFEAWIAPTKVPAAGARAGILDSNNRFGVFLQDDGFVHCRGGTDALTKTIPLGTFTHVACVWDGANLAAYQDGRLVMSQPDTAPGQNADQPTNIGSDAPTNADVFDGKIDDLRVWSIVRSPDDIAAAARP